MTTPQPEKWDQVLAAVKSAREEGTAPAEATPSPPSHFAGSVLQRVRAFHATLATWQRWSLTAGVVAIVLFVGAFAYFKWRESQRQDPLIPVPSLELPMAPGDLDSETEPRTPKP